MAQETELKLWLHAQDLPRLLAHPLLAVGAPLRQRLLNTYFDTPDLRLARRRVAVRERRVGRRTLLTVKTAGTSTGGLSQRGEWEGPTQPGAPDFMALVTDAALAQELTALSGQLQPLFCTDFTRRSWLLEHRSAVVEVALDQGQISTGHTGPTPEGAHSEAILELELELKSGPAQALFDLALNLAGADERDGDGGLWLMPADRSKAERGVALFLGRRVAPQKATVPALQPDMPVLRACRAALQDGLAHLQANLTGLLPPPQALAEGTLPDPEFVHQARVALRRLRAVLGLFRERLPAGFAEHWSDEWKDTATALGEARNWDVLDDRLLTWLTERAGHGLAPEPMAPLADWLLTQRLAANRRVTEHLHHPALAHRLLAFAAAVGAMPDTADGAGLADEAHDDLVPWALHTLRQRQRKLLKQARQAHTLDLQGLHALRIRFKKLRYAQSCLQSLLPPDWERSTPLLVRVQEELGELNDLVTAQDLLQGCNVPGADAWRKHLQNQQARALLGLPRLQGALSRMPAASTD